MGHGDRLTGLNRLGRTLALAHKAVHECVDERMAGNGASLATWLVLHHAVEEPDLSQSHLAARLVIEAPTLVRHLDRLEADGLLERRRDARDRRVVRVRVTAAGREAETRLRAIADAMNAELRAVLGDDHEIVERALERIREYSLESLAERKSDANAS
jgi:MarR family transcriptional regulator, transcriptional regulator for hemolysin